MFTERSCGIRSFFNKLSGILFNRKSTFLDRVEGGDCWEEVGTNQFNYLIKEGLRTDHYLLEVPCGSFRAGRLLVDYLDKGHYFGLDGSRENVDNGIRYVLKPAGLLGKDPKIDIITLTSEPRDYSLILPVKFDFIWMHALFDHIPPETIKQALIDFNRVLKPGGKLYATIFLNPHGPDFFEPMIRPRSGSLERAIVTYYDREFWHHTVAFFKGIVTDIPDLRLDACLFDYPHPLGLRMLRFIRSGSDAGS